MKAEIEKFLVALKDTVEWTTEELDHGLQAEEVIKSFEGIIEEFEEKWKEMAIKWSLVRSALYDYTLDVSDEMINGPEDVEFFDTLRGIEEELEAADVKLMRELETDG